MRGFAVQQPVDPLLGTLIADRYLVLQELGAGGFGTVYMAEHAKLKQPVAIKVLHQHLLRDQEMVARFEREADAASRLQHEGLARVYDVGFLPDGRPYTVMEYLSGETLADIIKREGPVQYGRALPWFVECCDALRYAHKKGMLHRDIKPDNIFVFRNDVGEERAKLLDFGLAKLVHGDEEAPMTALTASGVTMGTPWYMSPEQCAARPLDGRTDIYSLAYTLYEALAGRRPFPGRTQYEAMDAHLHNKLPPLNREYCDPIVPARLDEAIQKACAKMPNDRFSTAEEFRDQLQQSLDRSVSPMATPLRAPIALARETLSAAGDVDLPKMLKSAKRKRERRNRSAVVLVAVIASLIGLLSTAGGVVLMERARVASGKHVQKTHFVESEAVSTGEAAGRGSQATGSPQPLQARVAPTVQTIPALHKPAPPVVAKSVKIERPPAVAQSPQQTITHAVTPQQMASQPLPQLRMPEPQYIEPIQFPDTPLHVGHYINEEPAQRLAEQQPPPNYGSYSNTTTPPQKEQQPAGGIIGMPIGNGQQLQQGQAGGMPNAGPMGPFGGAPFMPMMRR